MQGAQQILKEEQIEAFYHDNFVTSQVADFVALVPKRVNLNDRRVVDIGGGCGFFAKALSAEWGYKVRVVDADIKSIEFCMANGVEAICGDALAPNFVGDEGVICFNLILHHLVGASDSDTYSLQARALQEWYGNAPAIFVNEYIYESFIFENFSGWLIYKITSSRFLSRIGRAVSWLMPTLKANTFGTGVRFRAQAEWVAIFDSLGFDVVGILEGQQEGVSLPRRLLLIKNCRRDSFLLVPRVAEDMNAMDDRR